MAKIVRNINRILVFFLLLFAKEAVIGQNLVIVENHVAKASIIISPSSSAEIKDIAAYLKSTIQKSTGALLPISTIISNKTIQIHIGYTDFVRKLNINTEGLDEDGFIIRKVDNSNFIILGGSDWGTEFGVYSFLERFLEVQFLMPTDIGTAIPILSSIYLPNINIIDNPIYISRQISPININRNEALGKWGRLNRERGRIEFHHNLSNLYDPKEFLKTNPQFFGGNTNPIGEQWQPNFSAKGIADSGAAKIIRFFKSRPDATSYSLGINDFKVFDESDASLKRRNGIKNFLGLEDVSDDYFQWANAVVQKVTNIFPDKKFGLLAYSNVSEPPSPSIGIDPHIVPFITYERMRWSDSSLKIQGHNLNNAWSKEAKILGWYDYTYGLNYLVPRVWFHEMQDYLKWGAQHNVKYYYAELYPNWGEGPKPWVQAKLLWDPNYNVDSLLNVWYVSFAGDKAAPKLKAFYSIWETFWTKDIFSSKWNTDKGQYLPFNDYSYLDAVPDTYVRNADNLINAAYSLAFSEPQKQRVQKLLEMWQIYKTAINLWQQSKLPTNKKNDSLINSTEFISLLNNLENDPIHSLSIQRIKMALNIK